MSPVHKKSKSVHDSSFILGMAENNQPLIIKRVSYYDIDNIESRIRKSA